MFLKEKLKVLISVKNNKKHLCNKDFDFEDIMV